MKDSDSGRCHVLTSGSWQRAVGRRRLIVLIVNIIYQKKLEIEIPENIPMSDGPLSILIGASIEGIVVVIVL